MKYNVVATTSIIFNVKGENKRQIRYKSTFQHGSCGHNLGVDRVHSTWPELSLMIKCISLPCLSSIHCLSSRSGLGAHQHAIKGSAWPECFELHCDSKAVT